MRITNQQIDAIKNSIRDLLLENARFLKTLNADPKDVALLQKSADEIGELFLIVVAGEYNSGKSAFINALLGNDFLDMGITPTTDAVTILKFGESVEKTTIEPGFKLFTFPSEFLKDIRIVDTPGTNAITREHEILTTDFIPQSDIVLFITSADRSFSESERIFLEKINNWGKKIVFIINKIDILESVDEVNQVIDYVRDNALKLLGQKPRTFALSAKNALNDISSGNENVDFEMVTRFITNELDTIERIQLKLTNPVSVLLSIASSYDEENERNLSLLKEDKRLVSDISSQLKLFKEDSLKHFKFRYADIDNTLLEFENRGVEFFDETFRIGRLIDLINKERIQREYREIVIADLEKEIDDKVDGLIHWLVEENFKQWQMVNNKINQRMSELQKRIIREEASSDIQIERKNIVDGVRRQAQRIIEDFNKKSETTQIGLDAQIAVAASAAVEVGAIGLGTLVTILATTASADLTGLLLAGLTATLGMFIIPTRRTQIKTKFTKKIEELRKSLSESLNKEIEKQLDIVTENIKNTIAPYDRFIRSEEKKFEEIRDHFSDLRVKTGKLSSDISQIK